MNDKTPIFQKKSKLFRAASSIFFNTFFPSCCELCRKKTPPLEYLCLSCRQKHLPQSTIPHCLNCGTFYPDAQENLDSCTECFDQSYAFNRNLSALPYKDELKPIMLAYKFGKKIYLARLLANFFLEKIAHEQLSTKNTVITFVPIHSKRYSERRFNQAEEIALLIAKKLQLPCLKLLKKTLHTEAQANLDLDDRTTNLKGAFSPMESSLDTLPNQTKIWLIDDVFTTGATVHACAKILIKSKKITQVTSLTAFHG